MLELGNQLDLMVFWHDVEMSHIHKIVIPMDKGTQIISDV